MPYSYLTMIESPLAGAIRRNTLYARRCLLDSIDRGEHPFAPHLLYPQVLDDRIPTQRELGISLADPWFEVVTLVAVYTDYGISPGMRRGIERASAAHKLIEFREIGTNPLRQQKEPSL